jgi:hypothetical protein
MQSREQSAQPAVLIQRTLHAEAGLIEHVRIARKSFATRFQLGGFSDK